MQNYLFYWFGSDGHIKTAADIVRETDAEAQLEARNNLKGFPRVEVWLGAKLVSTETGTIPQNR